MDSVDSVDFVDSGVLSLVEGGRGEAARRGAASWLMLTGEVWWRVGCVGGPWGGSLGETLLIRFDFG